MRLIDSSRICFTPNTWKYKLYKWFNNNVNWCSGVLYGSRSENPEILLDKPDNKLYDWFYTYWLFPFKQNDCICCNAVRGLIYGAIAGFITGSLL